MTKIVAPPVVADFMIPDCSPISDLQRLNERAKNGEVVPVYVDPSEQRRSYPTIVYFEKQDGFVEIGRLCSIDLSHEEARVYIPGWERDIA